MKTASVHIVINEAAVAVAANVASLIEPLWDRVNIYGSWAQYEASLRPFSTSQRHVFAVLWYRSEVNSGGHDQFLWNPTGIVCEHAIDGLLAIGLAEAAANLATASERIGGASRDRATRQAQVDAAQAMFDDLDERFFELNRTGAVDQKLLAYARLHAPDFRFDGTVERVILPPRRVVDLPN